MALELGVQNFGGSNADKQFAWIEGQPNDFDAFGGMQNLLDVGMEASRRECPKLMCGLGAVAAARSAEVYCVSVICSAQNNNRAVSRFCSAIQAAALEENVSIENSEPVSDTNHAVKPE